MSIKRRKTPVQIFLIVGIAISSIMGNSLVSHAEIPTFGTVVENSTIAGKDKVAIAAFKAAKAAYRLAVAEYKAAKPEYSAQIAAYKTALAQLKPVLRAYATARKVISQTFSSSVSEARSIYQAVLGSNPTAEDALEAKNVFSAAKANAVANRAAALASLGTAPSKPTKPAKPVKPVKPVRP